MNQGIEILLKRRETNPKEFSKLNGRWKFVLGSWGIKLGDPNSYFIANDNFTNDVLKELLSDPLEPIKSGAISRAQFLKEILPGLNELFGTEYAKHSEEQGIIE